VGKPSRPYEEEKKALIFHEVSHLIFFSFIGFKARKRTYEGIMSFAAKIMKSRLVIYNFY